MDLHFLRELTESGPVATVHLDASHDTEDADRAIGIRWADLRSALAGQGADDATLEALGTAITEAAPVVGRAGRVLVARDGEVLLDRLGPEPPAQSVARWDLLPDLLPMLVDQPEPVSVVVVRVDHTGGDIFAADPAGPRGPEPVEEVKGSTFPLHKAAGGGTLRMQDSVEETWRQNAAELAGRVDVEVSRAAARVLVVAGDDQSRALLRCELGERAAAVAVDLDHSGGREDLDRLAVAVDAAVLDVVNADRRAVLDRYEKDMGRPDGLAVDGIEPVLAALRAEAVDTLLVDGSVTRDAQVWISEVPTLLATTEDELRALGAEPTATVPVDPAMLRAAAASGASFVPIGGGRTGLVGHDVADGVAALLRYPLPAGA